jgi:TM2 domain-containing membrane protein YozV
MSREEQVYDLGELQPEPRRPTVGTISGSRQRTPDRRPSLPDRAGVGPALAGSLSMFIPGLGQLIEGEIAWGLFFLTGIGFCAASLWALWTTLDRLVPVLRLLEVPREALVVAVSALTIVAMGLHLAGALDAETRARSLHESAAPHPIVAGLASLLIPGWGQLLSGNRARAALFLGGVWCLGAAWSLVTPAGTHALSRLGLIVPAAVLEGWGPVVLLSAPIVLGVIAVYDAAVGAAVERNR